MNIKNAPIEDGAFDSSSVPALDNLPSKPKPKLIPRRMDADGFDCHPSNAKV